MTDTTQLRAIGQALAQLGRIVRQNKTSGNGLDSEAHPLPEAQAQAAAAHAG